MRTLTLLAYCMAEGVEVRRGGRQLGGNVARLPSLTMLCKSAPSKAPSNRAVRNSALLPPVACAGSAGTAATASGRTVGPGPVAIKPEASTAAAGSSAGT